MRGQFVEANLGLDKQDENVRLMNGSKQNYLVNGTPIMYTVHRLCTRNTDYVHGTPIMYTVHVLWLFHDVSLQLLSKV